MTRKRLKGAYTSLLQEVYSGDMLVDTCTSSIIITIFYDESSKEWKKQHTGSDTAERLHLYDIENIRNYYEIYNPGGKTKGYLYNRKILVEIEYFKDKNINNLP